MSEPSPDRRETITGLARSFYDQLARFFPVAAASDEFYYFPQAAAGEPDWSRWDDFSEGSVDDFLHFLDKMERCAASLEQKANDVETRLDLTLLQRASRTLREQLAEVRAWQTQPTFYLALAGIGLAQALETQDLRAFSQRAAGLPAFFRRARKNLVEIPELFQELGREMAADLLDWILSLPYPKPLILPCGKALEDFIRHFTQTALRKNFRLPEDLFSRVLKFHLGCGKKPSEIQTEIEGEIEETQEIMSEQAARLAPGRSWQEVLASWPVRSAGSPDLIDLYRQETEKLGRHCVEQGLVSEQAYLQNPVRVEPVPPYLAAVRTAAAYSMPPRHPPVGGTFYILARHLSPETLRTLLREAHLLAAHETYPGHHLLDLSRWSLDSELRRPLEFPLFYEGWACFAEGIPLLTGLFQEPPDSFLLARRRYWRAVRGKVDLGLQTGRLDFSTAARLLVQTGIKADLAKSMAKKYALHPGYEVCYTIGFRRFRDLFSRHGHGHLREFVGRILNQGEMGFDLLETLFSDPRPRGQEKKFPFGG